MFKNLIKNYFILSNLIILIILIIIGKSGPLMHLDFADWHIDKAQRISEDLKNFIFPGWDYSIMDGWNSTHGSVPINHILVILNIFFDSYTSAHLFIFLSDFIIFFGTYFSIRIFFNLDKNISTLISVLFFLLLTMLNENYFIAQFTFFGFLILINFLFTKNDYRFLIGLVFSIIYFSFSYPPYTLPLAPSFHLATIFLVFNKDINTFKKYFFWFLIFWVGYSIYHLSLIISLLENYNFSNRAIWETYFEDEKKLILTFKNPIYLLFCLIIFYLSKYKLKNILISILIIFLPEIIMNLNLDGNFITSRISYSSVLAFALFFLYATNKSLNFENLKKVINTKTFLLLFLYSIIYFFNSDATLTKSLTAIILNLYLFFFIFLYSFKNNKIIFFSGFIFFIIFKLFTLFTQGNNAGFLHVDNFNYPEPKKDYKIVSLVKECHETIFNSSQVLIKGHKTLDGNSVFYSKKFANEILNIKNQYETCQGGKKFKHWNNRVFITVDEFVKNKSVLDFFIKKNVRIIRSREPIDNSELNYIGKWYFYNTSYLRYLLNKIDFFKSNLNVYFENFENKKIDVFVYEIKSWKPIDFKKLTYIDKYKNLKIVNLISIFIYLFVLVLIKKNANNKN